MLAALLVFGAVEASASGVRAVEAALANEVSLAPETDSRFEAMRSEADPVARPRAVFEKPDPLCSVLAARAPSWVRAAPLPPFRAAPEQGRAWRPSDPRAPPASREPA